jgi:hypothetical protein
MKLINGELPVFMNIIIDPIFKIHSDDRRAPRLHFIGSTNDATYARSVRSRHLPHTLAQVCDEFKQGKCFSH